MSKDTSLDLNYLPTLAASAPAFAAKSLLGDLPKGAIEHSVERRIAKKLPFAKGLKQGLSGRGGGRAIGGAIGILTAPVFLRGLQLAQSDNKSDRAKGLALIGGSSSVYTAQKGILEGFRTARVDGASKAKALGKGLGLGGIRVGYRLPAALAMGAALAAGQKKKKEKDKYLFSALGGGLIGGLNRGAESAIPSIAGNIRKGAPVHKAIIKALKPAAAAGVGGVAGGVVGGLVLAKVISAAKKSMEKKKTASLTLSAAHALGGAGGVGSELASRAAGSFGEALVGLPVIHQATRGLFRSGTAGKLLDAVPGAGKAKNLMDEARARQLAIGIREGIGGRTSVGWRGAVSLGFTVPELRINREAGQRLGNMLRGVPEKHRAEVLSKITSKISQNPKLLYTARGNPVPILSSMDRGARMALGKEPMYEASKSKLIRKHIEPAYKKVMYGGRNVFDQKGLPKGYHPRHRPGKFSKLGPDVLTAGLGAAGALSGIPGVSVAGMHGLVGGTKALLSRTQKFNSMAKDLSNEGIRDALFPGLSRTAKKKATQVFLETIVSPSSRSGADLSGAMVRAGLDRAAKLGLIEPARRKAMRAASIPRGSLSLGIGAPAAVGITAGHYAGKRRRRRKRKLYR